MATLQCKFTPACHADSRKQSSAKLEEGIVAAVLQAVRMSTTMLTLSLDLPAVKPSAIALGTVFTHAASLAVLAPVFGQTYHAAQEANTKEEFFKSKQTATAAASWGSSLVGAGVQTYGVGALINATGTLSYKGATYLGALIFMASSAPSVSRLRETESTTSLMRLQLVAQVVTEKRPLDQVAVGTVARIFETVGLSLFLTYWGTRTDPFQ